MKVFLASSTCAASTAGESLQAACFSSTVHSVIVVSDKGASRAAKQPLLTAENRERPSYYGALDA